jgi:SAM-dependent methyltransferase
VSDPWERAYAGRPQAFRHYPNEELVRFLGRTLLNGSDPGTRSATRVLEVGSGNGANLWAVAAEGFEAHGVDLAPAALRLAQATLDRRRVQAALTLGDALRLPYRSGAFEVVYDVVSLQHLPFERLGEAYREVHRVLRPGGPFFSCHMGAGTWDHDHGGGRLVGHHTFDNMGPGALFPDLGIISLPEAADLGRELDAAGFRSIDVEDVVKSYDGRTRHVQYLVVTCERDGH